MQVDLIIRRKKHVYPNPVKSSKWQYQTNRHPPSIPSALITVLSIELLPATPFFVRRKKRDSIFLVGRDLIRNLQSHLR
ncbi:hypothetical protein ESP47_11345 [Heyndrickxia coagulans]|nr:hypothetical protein [Heyndrickxia faecalis]MBT2196425.1 hypothetical protein [Heyndrickxia coagulans]NWN94893.1 hypothetical protein [Bacillus sp. (in: firmicutes)]MBT2238133.1 hypothetical protein [Heyndrickxia coagulans]MCU6436009.1 hypothetical protein [Heyndrickxia coagulans]